MINGISNVPKIEVESITTKFGTARLYKGYWVITSRKEGNHHKRLHRLFYEHYHKCTLLPHAIIHHLNKNKLDNSIDNLKLMGVSEHLSLHNKGQKHSKEHSYKCQLTFSERYGVSGYFRVSKNNSKRVKQGYFWRYQYYDKQGKRQNIDSVDILKLKKKVKAQNLPWIKFDKEECNVME